ncbi:MAG: UDP-4-amino-4,6-dideoxy-N-acetyl-beta-L-altrosamine transaminase [Proteobacteria bacterium]|nr:UDP-4-amino-4,6-dideoxy-N-acetyl-beta-L-altrosamine transaminase [Pseudomonadota bacterium]
MISYGRQTVNEQDVEAAVSVLRSSMITQGPVVEEFERELCAYTGAKYAVCCSNGTAALHLAVLAAGLGPGDGALTTPLTFVATANSALFTGATPYFSDIDPVTHNLDPSTIESTLDAHPEISAIMPVHFAGLPSDMASIGEIATRRSLRVIEDACHALGAEEATVDGGVAKVGACTYSDMTVFSFHPVKSITTGEGGAITTNDAELYERLKSFRNHGMRKPVGESRRWFYEVEALGYNYRLTDIQSAIGVSQLRRLDFFIERRSEIAAQYDRAFGSHPLLTTAPTVEGVKSAHHLYPIEIDFSAAGISREEWFSRMEARSILPQVHYIPVHLHKYYRERFGFSVGDFPRAEAFYAKEVSLPIFPNLTDVEAKHVVEAVLASLE